MDSRHFAGQAGMTLAMATPGAQEGLGLAGLALTGGGTGVQGVCIHAARRLRCCEAKTTRHLATACFEVGPTMAGPRFTPRLERDDDLEE